MVSKVMKSKCFIKIRYNIYIYNLIFIDKVDNSNELLVIGVPKSFECPHYDNPKNGVVKCGGRLCLVKCDDGYRHGSDTAFVYRCNPKTGQWISLPVGKKTPWPDCVPRMVSL